MGTGIIARLHWEGVVALRGHYFENIFLPTENILPLEIIPEIIVGYKFSYSTLGGIRV
ncbi:MAG: hypothetical protein ABIG69_19180 [Bacteroidota bacterium]